jgi:UDP-2,3-diacylglucosamine pyrophosphatase LpxH
MNRRTFLLATGAAAMIGATGSNLAAAATDTLKPLAFTSAPVLTNPSPDGCSVTIAVNLPATGWVEYGPTESLGQRASGSVNGLCPFNPRVLSFRITSLSPGQMCFYRVHAVAIDFAQAYSIHRGAQISSEIRSFRTLDPGAKHASFTIWNDTHENEQTLNALTDSLGKSPTDFLFWNGDVCNHLDEEEQIIRQYINPAGRAFADQTPVFFNRGNHDVRGRVARQLAQYVPGPGNSCYYSFRQGPIAAIVMDTGEDKPDDSPAYAGLNAFAEYRTEQRKWLDRAIEDPLFKSAPYRIAFLHIPLVWENPVSEHWKEIYGAVRGWVCDDGYAKWHDLLVRGKIQLVISGHTHKHALFPAHNKRPYAQLIGGGPKPEAATIISGHADEHSLRIVARSLAGNELFSHEVKA